MKGTRERRREEKRLEGRDGKAPRQGGKADRGAGLVDFLYIQIETF